MNATSATPPFEWPGFPYPSTITAVALAMSTVGVVAAAKYFDDSKGQLTISVMIVVAFVAATFASIIFNVPQVPSTEILVGGLATALGAVVAFWMGRGRD